MRAWSFLRSSPWYDSFLLPLWAACLLFAIVATWRTVPNAWVHGVLVTGPPYGVALAELVIWSQPTNEYGLKEIAVLACLMLSGAWLNPLIRVTISWCRRRLAHE
jgi:hypothetical protein